MNTTLPLATRAMYEHTISTLNEKLFTNPNKILRNYNNYTFVVDWLGPHLPLYNLTMTRAPLLQNQTFDLEFDGRFVGPKGTTYDQTPEIGGKEYP